jgi:hypothetical protein
VRRAKEMKCAYISSKKLRLGSVLFEPGKRVICDETPEILMWISAGALERVDAKPAADVPVIVKRSKTR